MNKIILELNKEVDDLLDKLKNHKNIDEKGYLLSCLFTKLLLLRQNERSEKDKIEKEREQLEKIEKEKTQKDNLLKKEIENLEQKIAMLKKHRKED